MITTLLGGGVWTDLNNDGFRDLYYTTYEPGAPVIPNKLRMNIQGTGFIDGAGQFLDPHAAASFSTATGDLNNDGHQDLVVQNGHPYPPQLWINGGTDGNSFRISLQGTVSNRSGIGSWIEVFFGSTILTHYTFCGENLMSQSSQHHHFGLRSSAMADSVRITYTSGHSDMYYDVLAGQDHLFVEGDSYAPVIQMQGELEFCAGGSVLLDAGEHEAYLWNTGETSQSITVTESGSYAVTTTNEFGVQGSSDTLQVSVYPLPNVEYISQNPACANEATGSIELENLSGSAIAEVVWSNGDLGAAITGLSEGEYQYVVTDIHGCSASGSISLTAPSELFGIVSTTPASDGNNGAMELSIFGGVPPYSLTLDGLPGSVMMDGLATGEYELIVTDANGCQWETSVIIESSIGIVPHHSPRLRIAPNPANELLMVNWGGAIEASVSWQIMDASGRLVRSEQKRTVSDRMGFLISLEGLEAGSYLLRLYDAGGSVTTISRFVKQ